MLRKTVCRMDAAPEPTWTYLQRVLSDIAGRPTKSLLILSSLGLADTYRTTDDISLLPLNTQPRH
jgi:hypothetical protein